jgi:hypothetical protein
LSLTGSIERRFFDDRMSAAADMTSWLQPRGGAFHAAGARVLTQSPMQDRGWAYVAGLGVEHVSDNAPLGLWPGAGDGQARRPLLRAHPLIDGGIVDATSDAAFGRTLAYANAEMQRWLSRQRVVRFGFAGFADAALAGGRATNGAASGRVDVGAGLRIRLPAGDRILRLDAAHGLSDGANALTVGWGW